MNDTVSGKGDEKKEIESMKRDTQRGRETDSVRERERETERERLTYLVEKVFVFLKKPIDRIRYRARIVAKTKTRVGQSGVCERTKTNQDNTRHNENTKRKKS